MKYLIPLLCLTSCGPYYVGRKPVDLADELVAQVPVVVQEPASAEAAPGLTPAAAQTDELAPLIGWDGKPVEPVDRPLHGVDTGEGGHTSLLSMYMDTKELAEQLELEVVTLSDMLDTQNGIIAGHDAVLAVRDARIAELELELQASEASREDLEARLVTAQIRRLEAEKQLLLNILGVEETPAEEPPLEPTTTVAATAPGA